MGIFDRFKSKRNGEDAIREIKNSDKDTMEEGASLVAKAWRDRNAEILRPVLSDDFQYTSAAVYNPMNGVENYLQYLSAKFENFRKNGIKYNPVIEDGETPDSKKVILYGNPNDPTPIIVVRFRDSKIVAMLMRPKTMYCMRDLNDSEKANQIVAKACNVIHNWIEEEVSRRGFGENDFCWLQYNPVMDAPSFQHMCFRLGKSVFSVIIYLFGQFHTEEEGMMAMLSNVTVENQLRECSENDLIACSVFLDINSLSKPTLCYTQKDEMVNLKADALSGSGIMSKWEINATAINITIEYLLQLSVDALSYTNVLTFYPQIFYYKDGQKYFAYVCGHPAGITVSPIDVNLVAKACNGGCVGKFANVGMCILRGNDGEFRDKVLYRCNSLVSNFKELIPIEEAISLFGTKV